MGLCSSLLFELLEVASNIHINGFVREGVNYKQYLSVPWKHFKCSMHKLLIYGIPKDGNKINGFDFILFFRDRRRHSDTVHPNRDLAVCGVNETKRTERPPAGDCQP